MLRILLLPLLAGALPGAATADRPALPDGPHRAAIHGIRLYYELHGQGPPLVLLHGGMGDGRQFAAQVPAFAPTRRLVVPDLCAQGRSGDRPGPLSYHAMAEDVVALLDTLGLARVDIMGWSDGGIVGLDLAIHHPRRVDHLITFGANFSPDGLTPESRAWGDTATAAAFGPDARRGYAALAPDSTHFAAAMDKILAMWRTQPAFTPAELGRIVAKTLVCAGEHDVILRAHTEALARAIPGARLWIVPGASHGAMLEQPDLVNRTVLAFLAR